MKKLKFIDQKLKNIDKASRTLKINSRFEKKIEREKNESSILISLFIIIMFFRIKKISIVWNWKFMFLKMQWPRLE